MQDHSPDPTPETPADDHLLEELAALTGLFNPTIIWQQEELLDDMDEQATQETQPKKPSPPND